MEQAQFLPETLSMVMAAKQAGQLLAEIQERGVFLAPKEGNAFVKEADQQAQDLMIKILERRHSGIQIIAEEQKDHRIPSAPFFTVDPLDNTLPYQAGYRQGWGTMIGYVEEGRVQAAVINLPLESELWVAEAGRGCYRNGQKWQLVRGAMKLDQAVIDLEIGPWLDEHCFRTIIEPLTGHCAMVKSNESVVGVDVVRGRLGLWVFVRGKDKKAGGIWDFTAPALAVQEAGGFACDPRGEPLKFDTVAMNGVVFGASEEIKETAVALMKDW